MKIENLNNAAHAAGFAMAADEPYEEPKREAQSDERVWESQGLVVVQPHVERQPKGEWLRNVLGLVWGRAPASPA